MLLRVFASEVFGSVAFVCFLPNIRFFAAGHCGYSIDAEVKSGIQDSTPASFEDPVSSHCDFINFIIVDDIIPYSSQK